MLDKMILLLYTRVPRKIIIIGGYILLILIGAMDYSTDYLTRMSELAIFPVCLTAAVSDMKTALFSAVFATFIKEIADLVVGVSLWIGGWNSLMTLVTYVIVVTVLIRFREKMINERKFAITDTLTGLYNLAGLYEIVGVEIAQSKRYKRPLSVIYFDCDNFKSVNDNFGHSVGDKLLRMVANTLRSELRDADYTFRWGGDEFIVLLPNTDEEGARIVTEKTRKGLLNSMRENDWPVTFSFGVATFVNTPMSLDEILSRADKLMYSVKNAQKDGVLYATY
jgi:diguanylate cyclase (GGDEF)-like protein